MNRSIQRAAVAVTLSAMVASSVGCAYVLYPERRGNHDGYIAGAPFVMDLLWLIPGIVPGVVFLIVDFSSGAIYFDGHHRDHFGDAKNPSQMPVATVSTAQSTVITPK